MSNRDVLEEFIQICRNETCLWNVKNKDYHNRNKRSAAYCKLIEKLKEIEPNADRDMVTKKLTAFGQPSKRRNIKLRSVLSRVQALMKYISQSYGTMISCLFLKISAFQEVHVRASLIMMKMR